jgi:hypothetical protein
MVLTGGFMMRVKNPHHEEYDVVQYKLRLRMSLVAELKENFLLTGQINNMTITVEDMKAFYFEKQEDIRTMEDI